MTYEQTIDYLFTRLPMYSRIGAAAYRKDLGNTKALCSFLGEPQNKFRSIHVAGTNGKGSTSHMLAAIFQSAGYKTGLYTSPHLKDFRERIRINGALVERAFVQSFVEQVQPLIDSLEPSFFEITVAMAFSWFAAEQVDIAIIEVGLGGRFDSTNIITPELSVITNISYDHQNILGDTLQKIAFEKAGIIKPSVPVIVGEKQPDTAEVFKQIAVEQNAPLIFADEERFVASWEHKNHLLEAEVTTVHNNEKAYFKLDLPGIYQTRNLVTVLAVIHAMIRRGWTIGDEYLSHGLEYAKKLTGLRGRWETIHESPSVILDVAHNEGGIRQLVRQIELTDKEEVHIVIGLVKDKDISTVLSLLPATAKYYFTRAQIPRALPEEELMQRAAAAGLTGNYYGDVNVALKQALSKAAERDLIVVCGSVFVVGDVNL